MFKYFNKICITQFCKNSFKEEEKRKKHILMIILHDFELSVKQVIPCSNKIGETRWRPLNLISSNCRFSIEVSTGSKNWHLVYKEYRNTLL